MNLRNTKGKNKIQKGGDQQEHEPSPSPSKPTLKRTNASANLFDKLFLVLNKTENGFIKIVFNPFFITLDTKLITENKINFIAYIYKGLLLIFIVFLLLLLFFRKYLPGSVGRIVDIILSKDVLHVAYSICRIVNIVFMFLAVFLSSVKVSTLIQKANVSVPFPVLTLGYIISVLPYMYDLITIVSASSIILMIYSVLCGGKKANTWPLISLLENSLLILGLIGFVLIFLMYILASIAKQKGVECKMGRIFLLSSITFVILNTMTKYFESMISYNASFWAGLGSENSDSNSNSNNDCVSTNKDVEENLKNKNPSLEILLNVILSAGIAIYLIVITVIGMIPYPKLWVVGNQLRAMLQMLTAMGIKFILTPTGGGGGGTEQKNAVAAPAAGFTFK